MINGKVWAVVLLLVALMAAGCKDGASDSSGSGSVGGNRGGGSVSAQATTQEAVPTGAVSSSDDAEICAPVSLGGAPARGDSFCGSKKAPLWVVLSDGSSTYKLATTEPMSYGVAKGSWAGEVPPVEGEADVVIFRGDTSKCAQAIKKAAEIVRKGSLTVPVNTINGACSRLGVVH